MDEMNNTDWGEECGGRDEAGGLEQSYTLAFLQPQSQAQSG